MAEYAYNLLVDIIRNHKLNIPLNIGLLNNILHELKTNIYRLKYMYLPSNELIKTREINAIRDASVKLAKILLDKEALRRYRPDPYQVALTRWCLRILYGLRNRIMRGDDNNPLYSIDIEGVEIVSVMKHPKADKLWLTKAEGILPYDIVTNIENIRKGEVRAAAILPPVKIMGVLSEAMYCSNPLPTEYKGKQVPYNLIYKNEVRTIIFSVVYATK